MRVQQPLFAAVMMEGGERGSCVTHEAGPSQITFPSMKCGGKLIIRSERSFENPDMISSQFNMNGVDMNDDLSDWIFFSPKRPVRVDFQVGSRQSTG